MSAQTRSFANLYLFFSFNDLNLVLVLPQLPFPVVGSLNGVHMFAKNQDVSLLKTMTNDATVVWKDFHDRYLARVVQVLMKT